MHFEHSGIRNTPQASVGGKHKLHASSRVRPKCYGTYMAVESIELRRQVAALQRENRRLKQELMWHRDSLHVLRQYIRDKGLVRGGEAQICILPHRGKVR